MVDVEHLNLIAIMRSEESGAALREVCTGMNGTRVDVHVVSLEDFGHDKGLVNGRDVLLLDVDPRDPECAERVKSIVHREFPATPVVVTAADVTIEDIRMMMSLGVVDVLPQPIRQTDLIIALDHAARRRVGTGSASGPRGKVIAFLKGGGGVGATTLAVQGGCVLAASVKAAEGKVCLLDLDIQFGTAGLYLDLTSSVGLPDLLESPERLDRSLLRGVMARHDCGLEVLVAPGEVMPLETVTPEFVSACLEVAREEYDYVLIDLPPTWTSWTYSALVCSDLILLVTQLTVSGVRRMIHQLGTLRAQGLEDVAVKIALNRHDDGWGKAKSAHISDAEKALGRKFDYHVANDFSLVSEAINQGVPLSKIKKRSKVAKGIEHMFADVQEVLKTADGRAEISAGGPTA